MFKFLLIIQAIVSVAMIGVILMQRSEGGGFAGGSPSGMMSARGAADFLTRSTAVLASLFVALSILLAAVAAGQRGPREFDRSLQRQTPAPTAPAQPAQPFSLPAPAQKAPAADTNQTGVPLAQ